MALDNRRVALTHPPTESRLPAFDSSDDGPMCERLRDQPLNAKCLELFPPKKQRRDRHG